MMPSTWNDTNQHWIPQFLLKGFGIPRNASSVYELDKETKAIVVRKVSEVASKPLLVTEQDDAHLKKIEDAAAKAIGILRKGADIEEMRSGDIMDGFYALHRLTEAMESINPYIGVTSQGSRTTVVDAFTATVKEAAEQKDETLDEQDFRKYIDECLNHEVLSVNGIRQSLFMWIPHVHRAPDGGHFVIGDSPVITVRSRDGIPLQRILPVSSRCVVTFTYNIPSGRVQILGERNTLNISSTLTTDEVNSLNAHYSYRTKSQHIYSRNKSILQQSATQPPEWAVPECAPPDYDADLMLKLLTHPMLTSYQKADIREIISDLAVSKFVSRTRQIRRQQTEE